MTNKTDQIKDAIARAIQNAGDPSLQAAAQKLATGNSLSGLESESQFPPPVFARSTW